MTETGQSDLTRFNLVASGLLICLGLFAIFWLIPNYVPIKLDQTYGLSAAFMPRLAAIAVVLLTLLHAARTLWHLRGAGKTLEEESEDNEHLSFGCIESINLAFFALGSGVYVVLLGLIGFIFASALALVFLLFLGGVRNPLLTLPLALGLPTALDQVLWYALTVRLPAFPYWP